MGVIQNQLNSALTGLTFLAQQTPQWQYGKQKATARMGLRDLGKGAQATREELSNKWKNSGTVIRMNDGQEIRFSDMSSEEIKALNEARLKTAKSFGEDIDRFLEENKQYLPEEYANRAYGEALREHRKKEYKGQKPTQGFSRLDQSAQAMSTAQESAQARDAEIQTIDSNMKNYVEMIREMRANGIIKSNKQMKSMIYKAEHQEDKK